MSERRLTKKFILTVEGETEQWYFQWLEGKINQCPDRTYNVAIVPKVQQSPKKFYKGAIARTTPVVYHICDMESNDPIHINKFKTILSEMKDAKKQKNISYHLGYSNFAFELWMVLHKRNCNGSLTHRSQYLKSINKAYEETFENLDQYKHEDNFKRCLGKLSLADVRAAIKRAEDITANNAQNGNLVLEFKGYKYYRDNPALSVHVVVREILEACGL